MWRKLGLDLEKHDKLLEILNEFYPAVYLQQDKRPAAMEYFDFVISEIHACGSRNCSSTRPPAARSSAPSASTSPMSC